MKIRTMLTIALATLALVGCDEDDTDDRAETVEVTETSQEAVEAPPVGAEDGAPEAPEPMLESVEIATFEMELMAEPPEGLVEADDGVVLSYTNFPGHFEVFQESTVKGCILGYEQKPFDVTFMRYTYADEDTFSRAVKITACPDLDAEKLARQWLEVEKLRDQFARSEATTAGAPLLETGDPEADIAGWAGRGFYRAGEGEPTEGPAAQEWKTFCGEKSGTPCDEQDWEI